MKALLYKQLRLVCHPMTLIFCLFGIVVIIPNYPYTVIFFYVTLGLFFSFLDMREKKDLYYTALLPAGFLIYALFNVVFLPSFYKNGYKVGVAFIKATIPMALLMLVLEALPHIPALNWLDDMDAATQLRLIPMLAVSIVVYIVGMQPTFRMSAAAYEKVDM